MSPPPLKENSNRCPFWGSPAGFKEIPTQALPASATPSGPLLCFGESETEHNFGRLESVWPWGTWHRRPRGPTAPGERYRTAQVRVWRGVAGGVALSGRAGDPVAGLRLGPRSSPVLSWDDIPRWDRPGLPRERRAWSLLTMTRGEGGRRRWPCSSP